MPFFRDLCSGIVGNFRNCMTTPLTRKKLFIIGGIILAIILVIVIIAVCIPSASPDPRGRDALNNAPLVRGSSNIVDYLTSDFTVAGYKYDEHFKDKTIGAQVISTSVSCGAQFKDAVSQTIDQLDFIKRLVEGSSFMRIAYSAQDVRNNKANNHRSILMALGGGHAIDSRLSALRSYFNLGVRILTLASFDCTNPWAKSVSGDPNNISSLGADFLKAVVAEMNRLGIAIDLAGSDKTLQMTVIDTSKAPVMFRGVGFNSLVQKDISLDQDILEKLKAKGGLVMLSLDCALFAKGTECTRKDFIEFLTVAKSQLGVSNIGIGGQLKTDGKMPNDLTYADFPTLFDELMNKGWTIAELEYLAGNSFINYLQKVEQVAKSQTGQIPNEKLFDISQLHKSECYTQSAAPQPTTEPSTTTTPQSTTTTTPPTTPTSPASTTTSTEKPKT